MKAVQIAEPGGAFQVVDREIPQPDAGEVLVQVEACSICHSDEFVKENLWPGIEYPRVPGHEIAGIVSEVGSDVTDFSTGDPVAVGWYGGHCGQCEACRHGDFVNCENGTITGITRDGGYAEYVCVSQQAVARRPAELPPEQAAPIMCAGLTVYNSLRNSEARPGDRVAVMGIGGLGHLALQYAKETGYEAIALSTSPDKEQEARAFGADDFIDSSEVDPGEALQERGGAHLIMATAPSGEAISETIPGLARRGQLMLLGVDSEPIEFPSALLIDGCKSIKGWASGTSTDSQETMEFSHRRGIEPAIETYDLEDAGRAYEDIMRGNVRYRAVLVP